MKNIVICCDGTGNQLSSDSTNVLRLFDSLNLDKPAEQIAFYDPGVGTLAQPGLINPISKRLSLVYGLTFGVGFTRNLEESYRFLMHNYEPGDRVFLFGFSRGAFTVRALAGMVQMFGLLRIEHENLLPYVSRAYENASFDMIKRTQPFTRRPIHFEFLGVWDSVSSLGFTYDRLALPFTANNPSVHVIRQALSIDERRAYFRQNMWGYKDEAKQNIKQVWFAGVHSDVGGGYPESENTLSKIPFEWMVEEARHFGLLIDMKAYQEELNGSSGDYGPDSGGIAHESLQGAWWILECVPKNATLKREDFFLPLGQRRRITGDADHPVVLHQSVIDRMKVQTDYRPPNLPASYNVEPWTTQPAPTSPASPIPLRDRLVGFLTAFAWVVGFYYVFIGLLNLIAQAGLWFIEQFVCDPKPTWVLGLFDAVAWPRSARLWLSDPDHVWLTAIFALPLIVFAIGAWLQEKFSHLGDFAPHLNGKLLHLRWLGYDTDLAKRQFTQLEAKGRAAYRRQLLLDLLFPFFYGTTLIASLYQAYHLGGLAEHWLLTLYPWILGLPLVTAVADWTENIILLRQLRHFEAHESVSDGTIRVASAATMLKLFTFSISVCVIALVLILHLCHEN